MKKKKKMPMVPHVDQSTNEKADAMSKKMSGMPMMGKKKKKGYAA